MQELCKRQGNGICLSCNNPDNLLCRLEVERIVDWLRMLVNEYVVEVDILEFLDISQDELKELMGDKY